MSKLRVLSGGFQFPILLMIAMTGVCSSSSAQLENGQKIVFLGDSITAAGARENGYITLFTAELNKVRPDSGIEVIGAGIGGHRVPDLEARLDRDVLSHSPDWVVIYIGINDVWHSIRDRGTPADAYEQGLKNLISRCREKDAGVILCTPSVIGEKTDGSNQLDELLDRYCEISRQVAAETETPMLDLRKHFLAYLNEYNTANAEKGILTSDTVHLNNAGNRFVAARMLEATGVRPTAHKVLRHVVLFKYVEGISAADLDSINQAFSELQHKIPGITAFERGTNNSPEGLSEGFTHGYIVTFESEEARDAYLPHPAHKEFVEMLGGKLEKPFVFDFWTVE